MKGTAELKGFFYLYQDWHGQIYEILDVYMMQVFVIINLTHSISGESAAFFVSNEMFLKHKD